MPNWCHNTLTVVGDPERVAAYVEHVKTDEQPLSFAQDVPEPPEFPPDEGGLFPGWYGWRIENWGTKWDAAFGSPFMAMGADTMDIGASEKRQGALELPGSVQYKFDTAWSPPHAWLVASSEKHPELEFTLRFGEVGNDVAGELKAAAGVMLEENDLEVDDVLSPEEMWF